MGAFAPVLLRDAWNRRARVSGRIVSARDWHKKDGGPKPAVSERPLARPQKSIVSVANHCRPRTSYTCEKVLPLQITAGQLS